MPMPGVSLSASHEVDSMAKLIVADQQVHQIFELRCRSKTPGGPLKLTVWLGGPHHLESSGTKLSESPVAPA